MLINKDFLQNSQESQDPSSRRAFLKASGALVIGSGSLGMAAQALSTPVNVLSGKPALVPTELDSWVAVLPDGSVSAFFGKMDMGQSLEIAIAQIVAEELDVAVDKVQVYMGDSGTSCNQGGASGSFGVSHGSRPLRNAACEARRLLVDAAAMKLGVQASMLRVDDGVVSTRDGSKRTSYAELIGGRYFRHQVEWNKQIGNFMDIKVAAKPKSPSEYKIVGKSFPRRDVAGRVFGTEPFVTDKRLPGMLHARIVRPPSAGSTALSVEQSSLRGLRGVQVVHENDFVAVLAPKEWDAVRAASLLKVNWSAPRNLFPGHEKIFDHIRQAPVSGREDPVKSGDVAAAFKTPGLKTIEVEYEWPLQSHASMGGGCALADVRADGSCTVWTGSQKPHSVRDGVANLLKLDPLKVRAIWVPGAGSYGRNDAGDAASDAAYLSNLVGKPVRVQYSREEGTAWDPKGPACVHRARAAIDASGKVVAYEFIAKGFSRVHINTNEADPGDSLIGQSLGRKLTPGIGFGTPSESYAFPNKRLGWETVPPLLVNGSPLRTAHLRDPVGPEIHFGSEQFIDEIAASLNEDPVAFRLRNLSNARHQAVVRAAAEKSGWQSRPSPAADRSGTLLRGRGIAFADRNGTAVATVAEVEVDRSTGRVWVRKFTVAHDCGLIVNPQGIRYTVEGNCVQGTSRTLFEEVQFDANRVTSNDWVSYPILDIKDAPESIEVVLINRPDLPSSGAGEPSIRTIPAAIANAFFDATGVRMRRAPLTPERVKAALARA